MKQIIQPKKWKLSTNFFSTVKQFYSLTAQILIVLLNGKNVYTSAPLRKLRLFQHFYHRQTPEIAKGRSTQWDSQGLWDSQVWELVEDWRTPFRMVFTMLRCLKLTSLDTFQTFLEMVIFGELGTVFLPCFAAQTIKKVMVEKQNYSKDRFCFLIVLLFQSTFLSACPQCDNNFCKKQQKWKAFSRSHRAFLAWKQIWWNGTSVKEDVTKTGEQKTAGGNWKKGGNIKKRFIHTTLLTLPQQKQFQPGKTISTFQH